MAPFVQQSLATANSDPTECEAALAFAHCDFEANLGEQRLPAKGVETEKLRKARQEKRKSEAAALDHPDEELQQPGTVAVKNQKLHRSTADALLKWPSLNRTSGAPPTIRTADLFAFPRRRRQTGAAAKFLFPFVAAWLDSMWCQVYRDAGLRWLEKRSRRDCLSTLAPLLRKTSEKEKFLLPFTAARLDSMWCQASRDAGLDESNLHRLRHVGASADSLHGASKRTRHNDVESGSRNAALLDT